MKVLSLLIVVVLVAGACAAPAPTPPTWPAQYEAEVIYEIPYINLVEPFRTVYDSVNGRQVWDFYNGMDVTISDFANNVSYQVFPMMSDGEEMKACEVYPPDYTLFAELKSVLPDLSKWIWNGTAVVNGVPCNNWVRQVFNSSFTGTNDNATFTNVYNFYTDVSYNNPVQIHMYGVDYIFGSHPDIYIYNFVSFNAGYDNATDFDMPSGCSNTTTLSSGGHVPRKTSMGVSGQIGDMVAGDKQHKATPYPEHEFRAFMEQHSKQYAHDEEYQHRLAVWRKNNAVIDSINAQGLTYKCAMNHFGDLEDEEFRGIYMPHTDRPVDNGARRTHELISSPSELPTSVDWVQKGVVAPPKDQAACGSCWTFGSVASLEGVAALKYGKLVRMSEQQIVDCDWSPSSAGCNGGLASAAYQWIMDNGGIATEDSYPYKGQDMICNQTDVDSGIKVDHYVNVTAFNETALQDAVANIGPVAIAIDAATSSFRFYSAGVYYNPQCQSGYDYLDHEVTAVGYGEEDGEEFWLVKNSWSTTWGNQGYIRMARNKDNNCGIASEATYPVVV